MRRRSALPIVFLLPTLTAGQHALGQASQQHTLKSAKTAPLTLLQPNIEVDRSLEQTLTQMQPPTSTKALEAGNDLFLNIDNVVVAGLTTIGLLSAIPQTDAIWLFSTPASTSAVGGADVHRLVASFAFDGNTLPDVAVPMRIGSATTFRMIARANGRYFTVVKRVLTGKPK